MVRPIRVGIVSSTAGAFAAMATFFAAPAFATAQPLGEPFQISPVGEEGFQPAVVRNATGSTLVAWVDANDYVLWLQRYDVNGIPIGSNQAVQPPNLPSGAAATFPAVAMNDSGAFVVVWLVTSTASTRHLYAQRFDASGAALGQGILVAATVDAPDLISRIAMDAAGDFVIAWNEYSTSQKRCGFHCEIDTNTENTYFRLYGANGRAKIPVTDAASSSYTTHGSWSDDFGFNEFAPPALAMDPAGDFVLGWRANVMSGSTPVSQDFAQRYGANGSAVGSAIPIDAGTIYVEEPALAMQADGGFVVSWAGSNRSLMPPNSAQQLFAQRFSSDGTAAGSVQTLASTTTPYWLSHVGALQSGGYVVSWSTQSSALGDQEPFFAQAFNADDTLNGAAYGIGDDFSVTPPIGLTLETAVDATGNLISVWTGSGSTDALQVFGRLFSAP